MVLRTIPYKPGVVTDGPSLTHEGYAASSQLIYWQNGRARSQRGWQVYSTAPPFSMDINDVYASELFAWQGQNPLGGIPVRQNSWYALCGDNAQSIIAGAELGVSFGLYTTRINPGAESAKALATNAFLVSASVLYITHTGHGFRPLEPRRAYFNGVTSTNAIGGGIATLSSLSPAVGGRLITVSYGSHDMLPGDGIEFVEPVTLGTIVLSGMYFVATREGNNTSVIIDVGTGTNVNTFSADTYPTNVSANIWKSVLVYRTSDDAYQTPTNSFASSPPTGTFGGTGARVRLEGSAAAINIYDGPFAGAWFSTTIYNGTTLMFCTARDSIYEWPSNFSIRPTKLTNSPDKSLHVLVSAENYVMSFGCTSAAGAFDPLRVRWADNEDRTNWTPSSTNNSGSLRLGIGTAIIAVRSTRGGILVWTDVAVYFIRYTGESEAQYVADLLGDNNCGAWSPRIPIEVNGEAWWISKNGVVWYYGGGAPRQLNCPVINWFTDGVLGDSLNELYVYSKMWGAYDSKYNSITWCFPNDGRYIRYDILQGRGDYNLGWSIGYLGRYGWQDRGAFNSPLALGTGAMVYMHDQASSMELFTNSVEWAPFDLSSQEGGDGGRVMNIRRVVIDRDHDGTSMSLSLYGRRYPKSTLQTKTYTVGTATPYTDVRMQARQLGMLISVTGTDHTLDIGQIRADVSPGPRR